MKVSADVFEAFMKCSTKCWLRAVGEPTSGTAYAEWVRSQNESYRADAAKRLIADVPATECDVVPGAGNLKTAEWHLAVGVELSVPFPSRKSTQSGSARILPPPNSSIPPLPTPHLQPPLSPANLQHP